MVKTYRKSRKSLKTIDIEFVKSLISIYNLDTKSRKREIVYQRNYLMAMLNREMTFQAIGDLFGLKHCAVMHAVKNHHEWMQLNDKYYQDIIRNIKLEFEQYNSFEFYMNHIHCETLQCDHDFVVMQIRFSKDNFEAVNGFVNHEQFKEMVL